jgi:hypothetical protein
MAVEVAKVARPQVQWKLTGAKFWEGRITDVDVLALEGFRFQRWLGNYFDDPWRRWRMIRWRNDYVDLQLFINSITGQDSQLAKFRPVNRDDARRDGYRSFPLLKKDLQMARHPCGNFFARKYTVDVIHYFMIPQHNDGRNLADPKEMGELLVCLYIHPMNLNAWHLLRNFT